MKDKELNIFMVFITQSYLSFIKGCKPKHHTLFHDEDSIKQVIQQFSIDHLSDTDSKDFMKIHRKCTAKKYFLFVTESILSSNDSLRFRRNLS